jgi:acylphosphatase
LSRIQAHVVVSGQVQGVWFRESTRREAVEHGLGGWVRNTPDGRVEAVLVGEEAAVRKVVEFMRQGPPAARVSEVQVDEQPAADEDVSFRVR